MASKQDDTPVESGSTPTASLSINDVLGAMSREELLQTAARLNQEAINRPVRTRKDDFDEMTAEGKIEELYRRGEDAHQILDQLMAFARSAGYHAVVDPRK